MASGIMGENEMAYQAKIIIMKNNVSIMMNNGNRQKLNSGENNGVMGMALNGQYTRVVARSGISSVAINEQ